MASSDCKKCGACCHLPSGKPCQYLLTNNLCRIYLRRLGKVCGIENGITYVCRLRRQQGGNYPNCPYNTLEGVQGKPLAH